MTKCVNIIEYFDINCQYYWTMDYYHIHYERVKNVY
jgi:hypothetical protein